MIDESTGRTEVNGNGTVGPYTGTFRIDATDEVEVFQAGSLLTHGIDYTLGGLGSVNFTVTTVVAVPNGTALVFLRKQAIRQASDYVQNEVPPGPRVERDLDNHVKWGQMLKEVIGRALKFGKTSTANDLEVEDPPATNKYLYYDVVAGKFKFGVPTGAGSITIPVPVADGGTGSTTAATARTALGVAGLTDENTFTKTQSWAKGANVASASPLALATDGNFFIVTGTVSFAAISAKPAGTIICLEFNNVLTMTHGANLELPGGANITTANGDRAIFVSNASGDWHCLSYSKASGKAVVVQASDELSGLRVSNNAGDATNDIDIAVGVAASDDAAYADRVLMSLTTAMTKRLDAVWSAGTGNGMRVGPSAGTPIANTTYHVFLIMRPDTGAVDIVADTDVTGANIAAQTNAAYTKKRRIRSIMRESGAIVAEDQEGDWIARNTPVLAVNNATPGTNSVTVAIGVPLGHRVRAMLNLHTVNTGIVYFRTPTAPDVAPSATAAPLGSIGDAGGETTAGPVSVLTNTQAEIAYRSAANVAIHAALIGYFDRRGRG